MAAGKQSYPLLVITTSEGLKALLVVKWWRREIANINACSENCFACLFCSLVEDENHDFNFI